MHISWQTDMQKIQNKPRLSRGCSGSSHGWRSKQTSIFIPQEPFPCCSFFPLPKCFRATSEREKSCKYFIPFPSLAPPPFLAAKHPKSALHRVGEKGGGGCKNAACLHQPSGSITLKQTDGWFCDLQVQGYLLGSALWGPVRCSDLAQGREGERPPEPASDVWGHL